MQVSYLQDTRYKAPKRAVWSHVWMWNNQISVYNWITISESISRQLMYCLHQWTTEVMVPLRVESPKWLVRIAIEITTNMVSTSGVLDRQNPECLGCIVQNTRVPCLYKARNSDIHWFFHIITHSRRDSKGNYHINGWKQWSPEAAPLQETSWRETRPAHSKSLLSLAYQPLFQLQRLYCFPFLNNLSILDQLESQ